jgi:hypothetical protein
MATAHGAGLMLVPVLLRLSQESTTSTALAAHEGHSGHAHHMAEAGGSAGGAVADVVAVGVHSVAMFLVMGTIAVIVFERVGLSVLRRAWFNLDRIWAGALIAAGGLTFVL